MKNIKNPEFVWQIQDFIISLHHQIIKNLIMIIQEIINEARKRSARHAIAECELCGGLGRMYGYERIENAEISSFEAGAKFAFNSVIEESCNFWFEVLKGSLGESIAKNCIEDYKKSMTLK